MWKEIKHAGKPEELIKVIQEMYRKSPSAITIDEKITESSFSSFMAQAMTLHASMVGFHTLLSYAIHVAF